MEELVAEFIDGLPWQRLWWVAWATLLGMIVVSLAALGKGADLLVKEAVALSERSGISKMVIGATIVSLGTTVPEAAVSVVSAVNGQPDLALGNAVGSIICDTGLILGISCIIAPLHLPGMVHRLAWIQVTAGMALVVLCVPIAAPLAVFRNGGNLPQWAGILFLVLLLCYLWQSIRWARIENAGMDLDNLESDAGDSLLLLLGRLLLAIALVVVSSQVLVPSVREVAERWGVPAGIIAATIVAFGTSLPELVTAINSARHGHGDLAVGTIVGADVLNVLFVAGAAAAVTANGLDASPHFFQIQFPAMLVILVVFRIGIFVSGAHLKLRFGIVLLTSYVIYLVVCVLAERN